MDLCEFVKESNRIEGIVRDPTNEEINELKRFIYLDWVTLDDAIRFVKIYQPNAVLRDKKGLDGRVGGYYPPKGDKYMAMKSIYNPNTNEAIIQYPVITKEYDQALAAFNQVLSIYEANMS